MDAAIISTSLFPVLALHFRQYVRLFIFILELKMQDYHIAELGLTKHQVKKIEDMMKTGSGHINLFIQEVNNGNLFINMKLKNWQHFLMINVELLL
jgi:hypothetical protein